MKSRSDFSRRSRLVAILLLAIVLVPYAFSRFASSWRRVSVHSISDLPAGRSDGGTLRVACYNIAHGRGLAESNWRGGSEEEREMRLRQIADLLRDLDADVVVLNEVDFDSSWSLSTNQARFLAEQAGYPHWVEQRNLDFRVLSWKWRFGNAILSRHPIVQAKVVDLPGYSAVETFLAGKKRAIECTIELNGERARILAVHLCHRSEAVRARSAEMIVDIASSAAVPTIVAGDFNSSPTGFPNSESTKGAGNAMDILDVSARFQRRPEQPSGSPGELTYHSARPASTIDWILVPSAWRIVEYRVEPSTLSDHRPIVAGLSLERGNDAAGQD